MSQIGKNGSQAKNDIEDYLTDEERRKLLVNLHRVLVWVGVKEPAECKINRKDLIYEMDKFHQTKEDLPPEIDAEKSNIELHHLIWRLINEKEITDQEQQQILEIIDLLGKKERDEEDLLQKEKLTHKQAEQVFNETAGVVRALLDLKDLLKRKQHTDETLDLIQKKVSQTKKWTESFGKVEKEKS